MSWIKTIDFDDADAKLKKVYKRVSGPKNNIDNVLKIHSLRPQSLIGHMTLYKSVLHSSDNSLPKWYLEAIGVYVSHLNQCAYCFEHHFAGFTKLIRDEIKANDFKEAILKDDLSCFFDHQYLLGFIYAKKMTLESHLITKGDITALKKADFDDGEILKINQVTSYFNYVNRSVMGLGVNSQGDILGLSPNNSDDPSSWNHN